MIEDYIRWGASEPTLLLMYGVYCFACGVASGMALLWPRKAEP